ncbi:hypothetical protein [Pelomonas sp. SE-A7]|uniref:hypothetical protein n=1 Tax=Pelomonas sp. SE-A7 TaxID=3054953 RepID=UPI00259CC0C8|nr:hypothetical protein [Pelomonas sp. SE-A7]MDM4765373.1 hypothetical protein [Pelomonas sp. SE-A7]
MIRRLISLLMLALLLVSGTATAMSLEPVTEFSATVAVDSDPMDEPGTEPTPSVESFEHAMISRLPRLAARQTDRPAEASSAMPAAPFLEGPQRPPRAR